MLAPALVLVVLALGAVAVDMTLVHTARRSAHRTLSAAADDAAAMIDGHRLHTTGEVTVDPAGARRVALAHLGVLEGGAVEGMDRPGFDVVDARVAVDIARAQVTVTATFRVRHVFLAALPGRADHTDVTMSATGVML
jgi:hypothetical protein